jgi:hypothetical protein
VYGGGNQLQLPSERDLRYRIGLLGQRLHSGHVDGRRWKYFGKYNGNWKWWERRWWQRSWHWWQCCRHNDRYCGMFEHFDRS